MICIKITSPAIRLLVLVTVVDMLSFSCTSKQHVDSGQATQWTGDSNIAKPDSIAISMADIGKFPYITPPEGYIYDRYAKNRNFAENFHFYRDSSIVTAGGKYFRVPVLKSGDLKYRKDTFSDSLVVAYYGNAIRQLGGVEVYAGDKPLKMLDMIDDDLGNQPVAGSYRQFIIRTPAGNAWFRLEYDYDSVRQVVYSVLFEGSVDEQVFFMPAGIMRIALERNGKVVLYVNFNKDQSILAPDGDAQVKEIARLMQMDTGLRFFMEAHTDSLGTPERDKRLSTDRVNTVIKRLESLGIKKYRLDGTGFGSERSLVLSDYDENKSKNRRIELIRTDINETGLREALNKDGKAVLHIRFETGKAALRPEEHEIVEEIAKLLNNDETLYLSIEGHTDDVGSSDSNNKLSLERAGTIRNELLDMGIAAKRLRIAGYGSMRPVVMNSSAENRAKNRRVEIVKIR
ncbi:MAG: OmpA family protein [Tannerella sp.]|jgi:outer membrane protein OmpA-like peptidoglycan-associated protein|nr:OmpA family protein [Tannerella sp.]